MSEVEIYIQRLKARELLPPLYPTEVWDADLSTQIRDSTQSSDAVRAGLLLWNDDLDASHTISQNISDATGSFWHAIMHRREGDASNAKYWWRRTDAHPAFGAVQQAVLAVLESETSAPAQNFADELRRAQTWLPERFVDACAAGKPSGNWLLRVQTAEIETLLNWCFAQKTTANTD